jgi:hypothetical protein
MVGIDELDFEGVGRVDDGKGTGGGVQCWHVGLSCTILQSRHVMSPGTGWSAQT